jgi:hypothetical protein
MNDEGKVTIPESAFSLIVKFSSIKWISRYAGINVVQMVLL